MKLTIATMCFNQLEDTKVFWGCLVANTIHKEEVELLVINNGSTDGTKEFIEQFVFPFFPDHKMINHSENIGVVPGLQEIYKESKGDVIAIFHNDLFILDHGWNADVMFEFENDPKVGLAGFLGAKGIGANGGRMFTMSNLVEAEIHGERVQGVKDCIGFDALAMICRRTMLDQIGGWDQQYTFNHYHDRDISLSSHYAGWRNIVIGIYCHHKSGITANRSDYGKWIADKMGTKEGEGDLKSYLQSEAYFLHKWKEKLPVCL